MSADSNSLSVCGDGSDSLTLDFTPRNGYTGTVTLSAAGLPPGDLRRISLRAAAAEHARAGLEGVSDAHYSGGHWLGSFATYLATGRGLPPGARECACDVSP